MQASSLFIWTSRSNSSCSSSDIDAHLPPVQLPMSAFVKPQTGLSVLLRHGSSRFPLPSGSVNRGSGGALARRAQEIVMVIPFSIASRLSRRRCFGPAMRARALLAALRRSLAEPVGCTRVALHAAALPFKAPPGAPAAPLMRYAPSASCNHEQ